MFSSIVYYKDIGKTTNGTKKCKCHKCSVHVSTRPPGYNLVQYEHEKCTKVADNKRAKACF